MRGRASFLVVAIPLADVAPPYVKAIHYFVHNFSHVKFIVIVGNSTAYVRTDSEHHLMVGTFVHRFFCVDNTDMRPIFNEPAYDRVLA